MDNIGSYHLNKGSRLYALDNAGNFRWKRTFESAGDTPTLICDGQNIIYLHTWDGYLWGVNQKGEIVFEKMIQPANTNIGAIGENGEIYCSSSEPGSGYEYYLLAID